MTFFHRFFRYIRPSVDPDTARDIDYQSMGNIRMIALVSLIRSFDHDAMISTVTVSYSILLCALAVFFSSRILKNKNVSHKSCLFFKLFFYIAFMVGAVFVDFRHYKAGNQMLTFHAANLIMVCFIVFKPWLSILLTGGTYLLCFCSLYMVDHAARIQVEA